MRAWRFDDSATGLELITDKVPQPEPGPDEVLIRVIAAGVTPTEVGWYPTTHTKSGARRSRAIPGHEFSGTIAGVGKSVSGLAVRQEVFGLNDWFADGATAQYCLTRPEWITSKPSRLTHAEAASVPIGALTAWQGLFDRTKLQPGERVLIHGGSGGVGVFAIQLARRHGAHVVTTASARHEAFLLKLGAERVIDYHTERFEESIHGIDVVFDAVGGETLQRSWGVLGAKGRLVTIAAASRAPDERTKAAFLLVEPNQAQLAMIGGLLEKGEIRPVVAAVAPFAQSGVAYAGETRKASGPGKVVIAVTE